MLAKLEQLTLYQGADSRSLGAVRIFILSLWLIKVWQLDLTPLIHLDSELYHPHGIMKLIPESLTNNIDNPSFLFWFKILLLYLIFHAMLGLGVNNLVVVLVPIILTLLLGYLKGFGGHVNHRELTLLYISYLLPFMNTFEAYSLRNSASESIKNYQCYMLIICLVIVLQYYFVGLARLMVGFPEVFDPEVMKNWIYQRNFRDNPYNFTFGVSLIESPLGKITLPFALPFSTAIELLALTCLWLGKLPRLFIIFLLACFHFSIFLIMNISFIENMVLLVILTGCFQFGEK